MRTSHARSTSWRARAAALALPLAASLAFATPLAAQSENVVPFESRSPAPLDRGRPEAAGMSGSRLDGITRAFEKVIAEKQLPGAVILVARRGRLVYANAFGRRDPRDSDPMRLDTIFRIYSMTKPMVSVAAMLLVEDGVLQLIDPVSKWLPPFKDVKVAGASGEVAAERPMTVQDLFRHTAGLPYGELTANAAVKDALAKAGIYKPGVIDFDARDMTGDEQVKKLAAIPLVHQPGKVWEYSLASDVLGRVVEAASGKRLGEFLNERVFRPLEMRDTAFSVPSDKARRLAEPFEKDPVNGTPFRLIDVSKPPGNDSGGAGAVSTAGDYLRFAQMLLNGGSLDGVRILSPTTIRYMSADHLGAIQPAKNPGGAVLAPTMYTFGLGFAVRPGDGVAPLPGSAGDYYWGGYAGTYFWIDPKEDLAAVVMMQSPGAARPYHRALMRQLVYQAIVD